HWIAGEIALKSTLPDTAKAQAYFDRALYRARQQQAKSWELRAAMSMARLWRDQGKRTEARDLLAPVYGWFTEGFDTRDLKEAKALLDDLVLESVERSFFRQPRTDIRRAARRFAERTDLREAFAILVAGCDEKRRRIRAASATQRQALAADRASTD